MKPLIPESDGRPISVEGPDGPLRLALFGAGKAARFHLKAVDLLDGVVLAGACSRSGSSAEALIAGRAGAIATSDPADLVDPARVDAAVVAVAHDQTAAISRSLIEAGIPVLIEKPAALTSAEVEDLAALAASRGVLALVAVNRRYYSQVQQALWTVRERGPVRGVLVEGHEATHRLVREGAISVGDARRWMVLNSIHYVDLLRMAGGDVDEVLALHTSAGVAAGDHVAASVRFAGGAVGTYVAHWNSAAIPVLRIFGDEVHAEVQLLAPEDAFVAFAGKRRIKLSPDRSDAVAKPGVLDQDAAFLHAVATGAASAPFPASDLTDHAASLRLVEDIFGVG